MTQPVPQFDYDLEIRKLIAESLDGETIDGVRELLADLPIVGRLDFDPRWEVGKPVPGADDGRLVVSMFDGDMPGDIRIYVSTDSSPIERKWFRYTASRVGATAMVETMNRKTFVAELAEEWIGLLTEDDDEDEPEPGASNVGNA